MQENAHLVSSLPGGSRGWWLTLRPGHFPTGLQLRKRHLGRPLLKSGQMPHQLISSLAEARRVVNRPGSCEIAHVS